MSLYAARHLQHTTLPVKRALAHPTPGAAAMAQPAEAFAVPKHNVADHTASSTNCDAQAVIPPRF